MALLTSELKRALRDAYRIMRLDNYPLTTLVLVRRHVGPSSGADALGSAIGTFRQATPKIERALEVLPRPPQPGNLQDFSTWAARAARADSAMLANEAARVCLYSVWSEG